jgi:hypothetical protein
MIPQPPLRAGKYMVRLIDLAHFFFGGGIGIDIGVIKTG